MVKRPISQNCDLNGRRPRDASIAARAKPVQLASVGSTDASASLPARVGVVGPMRKPTLAQLDGSAEPKSPSAPRFFVSIGPARDDNRYASILASQVGPSRLAAKSVLTMPIPTFL